MPGRVAIYDDISFKNDISEVTAATGIDATDIAATGTAVTDTAATDTAATHI